MSKVIKKLGLLIKIKLILNHLDNYLIRTHNGSEAQRVLLLLRKDIESIDNHMKD